MTSNTMPARRTIGARLTERAIKESSGKAAEGLLQGLLGGKEKERKQGNEQDQKKRKRP